MCVLTHEEKYLWVNASLIKLRKDAENKCNDMTAAIMGVIY